MKKIAYILLFTVVSVASSFAQVSMQTVKKTQFDTLHFAVPDYRSGIVFFNDGSRNPGALNIDAVRQMVMFIDPDGREQELVNNDQVDRVTIEKRVFYHRNGQYIELVDINDNSVGLGRCKTMTIVEEQQKGAYGMVSQTTSIKTIGSVYKDGQYYNLSDNAEIPFIEKVVPYIFRDGKFVRASKKVLEKAFPDKKAQISSYLSENRVDFDNFSQVESLYKAIN